MCYGIFYKKDNANMSMIKTHKNVFLNVFCVMVFYLFCVVMCVDFCTGHFAMGSLNLTYLHCLQHSFFEHPFNLYCNQTLNLDLLVKH